MEEYSEKEQIQDIKYLFAIGKVDIVYRIHYSPKNGKRGKWSGLRSFRKSNSSIWPWDMIGAPNIQVVKWQVKEIKNEE